MRFRIVVGTAGARHGVWLRPVEPGSGAGGLPLYAARWAEEWLRARLPAPRTGWLARRRRAGLLRQVEHGLARMGFEAGLAYLDTTCDPFPGGGEPEGAVEAASLLESFLRGRILLEDELVRAAGRVGLPPHLALVAAEALAGTGVVLRVAAVEVEAGGAVCRRCGAREGIVPEVCGRCGSLSCPRCVRCAGMGVARGCQALYAMPAASPSRAEGAASGGARQGDPAGCRAGGGPAAGWVLEEAVLRSLSPGQRRAWEHVDALVEQHLYRPAGPAGAGEGRPGCLIWAVAGAGKTEVAFGAAARVLQHGEPVLFAVPRREVAVDVARRARVAFGGGDVRLLVGSRTFLAGPHPGAEAVGVGLERLEGQMVVATTHQALRFYRAFPLVILDEADAYPYRGSDMLELAVERAVGEGGFMVAMSATPGRRWLARAHRAGWPVLHVPARHHGHPLPVPEVWVHRSMAAWEQEPARPERVPSHLRRWLDERPEGRRVLVFGPTVALVEGTARALGAPFCHSRDPERHRKLAAFAAGRLPVLVSTTLLERGLTFGNLDVLVVFADREEVFDEAALTQMAGRAGRSPRAPDGRVLFAAARLTGAMRSAVAAIEAMNHLARAGGLLVGTGDERDWRAEVV